MLYKFRDQDFLSFMDMNYAGNYLHENTENQQRICIQSSYL